jgi:hypothetical protein
MKGDAQTPIKLAVDPPTNGKTAQTSNYSGRVWVSVCRAGGVWGLYVGRLYVVSFPNWREIDRCLEIPGKSSKWEGG